MTALGAQSSAATIHLSDSMLKIVACAYGVMFITGMHPGFELFLSFIMMLGITMIGGAGVPRRAIMVAVAFLQSMLGFDETLIGLMIVLYIIAMVSFGTACNITGDEAIALIMNKIKKEETSRY